MGADDKKILELEKELESLHLRLNQYRQELNELKKQKPAVTASGTEDPIPPAANKDWEYPSYLPKPELNLENFIGLKLLHLAGIVVLVIGISIGVKYAVDKELISPAARIVLAYLAGGILFFSLRG